jgi:hypothetical protein
MSGRGVVRPACGAWFCGALAAASLIFVASTGAQQPDASRPAAPPPAATGSPAPAADLRSTLGRAPKDIPLIDPCKSAHPPSYCNVKD